MQNTVHAALGCGTCHADHEKFPHPAGIAKAACVDCHSEIAGEYARGVHARAAREGKPAADCAICHGSVHQALPPRSAAFRRTLPDTCGACHGAVVAHYKISVHGRAVEAGISAAPLCTDCHG